MFVVFVVQTRVKNCRQALVTPSGVTPSRHGYCSCRTQRHLVAAPSTPPCSAWQETPRRCRRFPLAPSARRARSPPPPHFPRKFPPVTWRTSRNLWRHRKTYPSMQPDCSATGTTRTCTARRRRRRRSPVNGRSGHRVVDAPPSGRGQWSKQMYQPSRSA